MRDTTTLSLGREVFFTAGSKAMQAILGFTGVLVFANVLGNVGLGEYRTVTAAAFILVQFSEGISAAVKKRISEVNVDSAEYVAFGLIAHLAFSLVVLFGILLVRPFAVAYFSSLELALGVAAIVATLGLFTLVMDVYSGVGYPARASWLDTVRSVFTLGLQVGFVLLGYGAFGLVGGLALATITSAVLGWLAVATPLAVPTVRTARRVVEFARYKIPTSFLSNAYKNADPLLIRALVGAGPVGFYTVASQLVMPGAMFAASIRNALTVKSSGVDSLGGEVRADLVNAAAYTGLLSVPILFGALAIPNALMTTLFGSTFRDAPGLALVGMALYQVSNTYRQPFEATIEGTDRPRLVLRVNVLVTLAYVPLAVGLGLLYGLLGVIFGTVLAEVVRLAAYQFVAARHFGGVVVPRPVGHQVASGVVMFAVVEGVTRTVVTITSWVWLVLVVALGAAVYFLTLLAISRHFRDTIRNTLASLGE